MSGGTMSPGANAPTDTTYKFGVTPGKGVNREDFGRRNMRRNGILKRTLKRQTAAFKESVDEDEKLHGKVEEAMKKIKRGKNGKEKD